MKIKVPKFQLARVYSDDSVKEAELYPFNSLPFTNFKTNRRNFLKSGIAIGTVLPLLGLAKNTNASKSSSTQNASTNSKPDTNLDSLFAHYNSVSSVKFSPDGKYLASGSYTEETIKIWSIPEGKLIKTKNVYWKTYSVNTIAFSPGGKILASGSHDDAIKLWSIPEGILLKNIAVETPVNTVAFSPDGKILASACKDNTVKLWSIPEGILIKSISGHYNDVNTVAFSPDGKILVSGSGGNGGDSETIKLWSIPEGKLKRTINGHTDCVNTVTFSPNGKILASGSCSDRIKIWSMPEGTLMKKIDGHTDDVNTIAFSPDGTILASGSSDDTIKLWSIPEGKLIKTINEHTDDIYTVAFSPDGKVLASGSGDNTIKLWNVSDGRLKARLYDLEASQIDLSKEPSSVKGSSYTFKSETGQLVTYTLPCGAPIPTGATCTCNCVPGSYTGSSGRTSGETYCSCNKVCSCVPVYY